MVRRRERGSRDHAKVPAAEGARAASSSNAPALTFYPTPQPLSTNTHDRATSGAGSPASPPMAPIETPELPDDASTGDTFTVLKQSLELDISFSPRRVTGKTVLDIQPKKSQLREIVLNCRQLRPTRIRIDEQTAGYSYSNLHERLTLYPGTGLEQYHFAKDRIARHVDPNSSADELVVFVPDKVKIREVRPEEVGELETAQGVFYAPLKLEIEYVLEDFRDAFHFVGVEDGDGRLPHAFTRNSPFPGTASCLFPCIDDGTRKCLFDVAIRYPRTLGDALSKARAPVAADADRQTVASGADKADSVMTDIDDELADLCRREGYGDAGYLFGRSH